MRIAITRLRDKGATDSDLCRRYGFECYRVSPLKATIFPDRVQEFADHVNRGDFDCIFFTSALPAQYIAPLLERWPRVIAIGPQTARTLEEFGIASEILPSYYSRDFAPYLGDWLKGRHIGIPRADVANEILLESIREQNGIPHEVRIYALEPTGEELPLADADAVIFTSAQSFSKAIWRKKPGLIYIAIGDITASAMQQGGVAPDVIGNGSLEGTLIALLAHIKKRHNNHD